jgi:D-arginine dehydrogenase
MALCPILKPEHVEAALFEPDASDVDVHSLHDGYLRLLKMRGGVLVTDADVQALERRAGTWRARTPAGVFSAPILVNAAGAWADVIAAKAGVRQQAISPRRRTALLIELPPELDPESWPLTVDIDETIYFRPDAGLLMLSPADETPVEPCDVQPEEIDVAIAIDRFERMTSIKVARLRKKWAGLRSFGPDRSPIIGYDPGADGFFWLAGQGGYGIQSAPAAAQLAADLVRGERTLDAFDPMSVSPARRQTEVEAV